MRKPREFEVIVHYPTTLLGYVFLVKQAVYADPGLVFEKIRGSKLPKDKKAELLALAEKEAEKYSHNDLVFYLRAPMPHKD